ncbi:unnamed protein product, partial [Heterotrigona itama]
SISVNINRFVGLSSPLRGHFVHADTFPRRSGRSRETLGKACALISKLSRRRKADRNTIWLDNRDLTAMKGELL